MYIYTYIHIKENKNGHKQQYMIDPQLKKKFVPTFQKKFH